jgi:hypothetical protein
MRVALIAVPALVTTACGGGSAGTNTVVTRAADATLEAGSEQFALEATARTGDDSVALRGGGAFDSKAHRGSVRFALTTPGARASSFDGVFDRELLWLGSSNLATNAANGKHWMKFDRRWNLDQAGSDLAALAGRTPADLLAQLRLAGGSVTTLGKERLGGVSTTHYRTVVDGAAPPDGDELVQQMDPKYLPADVWIDGDGLVRKVALRYSVAFGGLNPQRAEITMTMRFSKFGLPVAIRRPAASDSQDANKFGGN